MPLSYSIDSARRRVVNRASGVLTAADVAAVRAQLLADPAFDPDYRHLFDLRDVTEITITTLELEQMAVKPIFAAGVRRAYLAATPFQFGMARMFGALSEGQGQNIQAFRDPEDAEAWLEAE